MKSILLLGIFHRRFLVSVPLWLRAACAKQVHIAPRCLFLERVAMSSFTHEEKIIIQLDLYAEPLNTKYRHFPHVVKQNTFHL